MTRACPHTRRLGVVLGAALLVLVAAILGVAHAMTGSPHHTKGQLAEVQSLVAAVPLPPGTVEVDAQDYPGDASSGAYAYRVYRLPRAAMTADIVGRLEQAGYRPVDPHTGRVDASQWQAATRPDSGDVSVLPPGHAGDGINLNWSGSELTLRLQFGQVR